MVQLDYDESEEPGHAVHGSVPTQLEVQRATKWAEMWALYVALDTLEAPAVIFFGQLRSCTSCKAERLRASASSTETPTGGHCFGVNPPRKRRGIDVRVRRIQAHRTNKEQRNMMDNQRNLTQSTNNEDELASWEPMEMVQRRPGRCADVHAENL